MAGRVLGNTRYTTRDFENKEYCSMRFKKESSGASSDLQLSLDKTHGISESMVCLSCNEGLGPKIVVREPLYSTFRGCCLSR